MKDPKELVVEELQQFEDDFHWYTEHLDQLRQDHPDEWVAIYKEQTVFGETPENLLNAMKIANMPPAHSVMEFLSKEDPNWAYLAIKAFSSVFASLV